MYDPNRNFNLNDEGDVRRCRILPIVFVLEVNSGNIFLCGNDGIRSGGFSEH